MNPILIASLILLLIYFISKILNERAAKLLSPENKIALVDAFSSLRIYNISVIVFIVLVYFVNMEFNFIAPETAHIVYIVSLVCLLIVTNILVYKKLKAHDFPASYIKFYILINGIRFIGILAFLIFLYTTQYNS